MRSAPALCTPAAGLSLAQPPHPPRRGRPPSDPSAATRARPAAERLGRLSAWGQQLVDEGQAPFVTTLVARHGKIAHVSMAGSQNPSVPIALDSLCRMHSMSKPITSCALMMLQEEGKCELTDPAHLYLGPKWKRENMRVLVPGGTADEYETVPCETTITLHHLLTHTAGLSYGLNPTDGRVQSPVAAQEAANPLDGIYERNGVTIHSALGPAPLGLNLEDFVDRLGDCPLMYQPGSAWHYSLATDVCARLVEAISGMSFFVRDAPFGFLLTVWTNLPA